MIHSFLHILLIGFLLASPGRGLGNDEKIPILYINEEGLTFTELLENISQRTGYRIELVGEWPDLHVDTRLQGINLRDGLEKVIKNLGDISHILVFDSGEKKVKLLIINPGSDTDTTIVREFSASPGGESVSPPLPSGEPGITASELAAIKAEHRERQLNRPSDTEISPPSEYGPGLTLGELESIKSEYNLKLKLQDGSTTISPPSENGEALTKNELDNIKASHKKRIESQGPDTVISEPTEEGPGLTLGELEKIKAAHATKPVSDDTIVSPPFGDDPGLTHGELEAIKDAYRKRHPVSHK